VYVSVVGASVDDDSGAAASAAASAAARDAREGADANGERDVVDALPSSKKKPRKT
jgi:hypothetical protein